MKLLKEQIKDLKDKKEKLLQRKSSLSSSFGDAEITRGDGIEYVHSSDYELYEELLSIINEINEIDRMVKQSEVITRSKTDIIDIGTKFEIEFASFNEKETYTLVEENYTNNRNYITVGSPLGKSVLGKKQGDTFSYHVDNSNLDITGSIYSIESFQKIKKKSKGD